MFMKQVMTGIFTAAAMASLLASAQAAEEKHIFKFDDVAWQETGLEGAEMAVLWGKEEDGSAVYAFRIQPGVGIPPHTHSNDYWGMAIQGNWAHTDEEGREVITAQNAFVRIKADDVHSDRCAGPEVCINVLDFNGTRDIAFPQ
ncbi:cupin domain-containing protein [Pseudovibrio sp. SCP19]|uniref:cupin domain-containing protein n=1 Tax=Pseudovibrio sp. SCP19 TaxID=3141374 RepID=UPI0033392002